MIKGVRCWHIDHIIPCDWFDMNKPEEQAICFHWSNLQPLWADENLEKKARFAGGHNVRIYPVDGIAPDVMSIARAYGVGMRKDGDE